MPIDLDRCIIFVHIPKTGGTSIESVLGMTRRINLFSTKPIPGLPVADRTPQHFTWRELLSCLPPGFPDAAFKFAFVRNPWDRFVSEFLWRRRLRDSRLRYGSYLTDLDSFVRLLDLPPARRKSAAGLDGHLETQTSFLVDETGALSMDFIGRFECFDVDVREVLRRIGVPATNVPHLARGARDGTYRSWFSAYSRGAVESFYRDDVRMFGYRF